MKEKEIKNKIKELEEDSIKKQADFWKEALDMQALLKKSRQTINKIDKESSDK